MATTNGFSRPANEIAETDIIFECPHCAKSMAIDQRGAGLMISCPDCGARIQVPKADNLEIAPIPAPAAGPASHDQHVRDLTLALTQSREKVQQLMRLLDESRQGRSTLQKKRSDEGHRLSRISDELAVIQSAIDRIAGVIQDSLTEHADDGDNW